MTTKRNESQTDTAVGHQDVPLVAGHPFEHVIARSLGLDKDLPEPADSAKSMLDEMVTVKRGDLCVLAGTMSYLDWAQAKLHDPKALSKKSHAALMDLVQGMLNDAGMSNVITRYVKDAD